MKADIIKLYSQFIGEFDEAQSTKIWKGQSDQFRQFWSTRIMAGEKQLNDTELDEIILMLDKNAKGSTSETHPVAKTMIRQNKWHKMFRDLKQNDNLRIAVDNLFHENSDDKKIALLNQIKELNTDSKNSMTGKSANAINAMLALYNPDQYSFVVSLKSRVACIKNFGFELPANFDDLTWGERIIESNRIYLNGFKALGITHSPRTVSEFSYSEAAQPLMGHASEDEKDSAKAIKVMSKTHSMDTSLNQIFFGPPGTGKTYNTVNEAVKIVDPEFYKTNAQNRGKLKERFRELLIKDWDNTKGQIAFCTFHQSFSYEDFVEGIKPVKPVEGESYLKYKVEDGIFKRICRLSEDSRKSKQLKTDRLFTWNEETFRKAAFYKISLGDSNNPEDQEIFDYCIKNNCIAIGYGGMNDFTGLDETGIAAKSKELQQEPFATQALNYFIHFLKVGNYVLVSNGNRYVRAIGKVTGEYRYDPSGATRYNHYRSVEWLVVNENIPITDIYDRNLSQMTIYKLDESGIKKEFFVNAGQLTKTDAVTKDKNYVLVIDEINRGNVSSIFGELITLIEKDKRASSNPESEELEVTLPYSKEPFKVPDNVYIIGTMNTADRSIEALDTALRRRFSFKEMPSDPDLIRTKGLSKGTIDQIDLVTMLKTINQRIEKLIDKDHKIGHAYFMDVTTKEDLNEAFNNKVIPLLQEYFFGDFGKIGLVLGNTFVEKDNADQFTFADFNGYEDGGIVDDMKVRPVFRIAGIDKWKFASIYA